VKGLDERLLALAGMVDDDTALEIHAIVAELPDQVRARYPVFERDTSALVHSNDGRIRADRELNTNGWMVIDRNDDHVELFTMKRTIADAFIAGYDYAERIGRTPMPLTVAS
jgi:hypothetical protein